VLTQQRADTLMNMQKVIPASAPITFPLLNEEICLEAQSRDGRETFNYYVNRKGTIKLTKCTYIERYAVIENLVRLDLDGAPHTNPDGQTIPCPHIHIYREGFGDKWAFPLPPIFTNTNDLVRTFQDFLAYTNVVEYPLIQYSLH